MIGRDDDDVLDVGLGREPAGLLGEDDPDAAACGGVELGEIEESQRPASSS